MAEDYFLETERIYLRRFTLGDAGLLCNLDSDPEVMRYVTNGAPTPLRLYEEHILPHWMRYYEVSGHIGFWAAHEKVSRDFIGWFHLKPEQGDDSVLDLGYRLKRSAWGKGYATEVSRALIEKAFAEWGVERVVAHALEANRASWHVMEKCGMAYEGSFVVDERILPGMSEEERRAVRYGIGRPGGDVPEHTQPVE